MSSDFDHVLRGLEKQVMDFTMDPKHSKPGNQHIPTRSVSTHRSRRAPPTADDDDDDDDDDIIGHLLQNPSAATTSPKKLGLARSLSAGARKFPKKLLPNEPVPCVPSLSSVTPPVTTTAATITDDQRDAEDLHQAMQLAWAVLDAEPSDGPSTNSTSSKDPHQDAVKPETTKQPTTASTSHHGTPITPTKTMTTRIYIEDAKNHKTVQLTNLLTTAMVIQYLKRKDLIDTSEEWTLFEIANSHGVERPIRLWEIVLDITSCWEQKANNALLVKKYGFYETLTMDTIRGRPSPVHGYLTIEYKKGKWQKRYCFIKDHAIYHAKDSKASNPAILCHLAAFDVYTLLKPCSTSPTPFVFALRAQDRASIFEKEEDYMRLLTAENQACLETWVLGIRQAKSIMQYQQNSKMVMNPLAAVTPQSATSGPESSDQGLRRHKSTKREPDESTNPEGRKGISRSDSSTRRITDETIKRKASTRGLSRNGTTRNHHSHQHDVKDGTTSMAAPTSNVDEGNTTLIHLDDKVQFSKGSLLAKGNMPPTPPLTTATNPTTTATTTTTSSTTPVPPTSSHHQSGNRMARSKSTRETSNPHQQRPDGVLSHHASIRRKERPHDVPLPNTKTIMTALPSHHPTTDTTLLQLSNTPERFHTQTLLQRQMKPLLNFDQDVASDRRR